MYLLFNRKFNKKNKKKNKKKNQNNKIKKKKKKKRKKKKKLNLQYLIIQVEFYKNKNNLQTLMLIIKDMKLL